MNLRRLAAQAAVVLALCLAGGGAEAKVYQFTIEITSTPQPFTFQQTWRTTGPFTASAPVLTVYDPENYPELGVMISSGSAGASLDLDGFTGQLASTFGIDQALGGTGLTRYQYFNVLPTVSPDGPIYDTFGFHAEGYRYVDEGGGFSRQTFFSASSAGSIVRPDPFLAVTEDDFAAAFADPGAFINHAYYFNVYELRIDCSSDVCVRDSYVRGADYSGRIVGLQVLSVPEPASWAMLIVGFGGVGAVMRRRVRAVV